MPDLPAFVREMDRTGPWTPVPIRAAQAQPGGPVDHGYFRELLASFEQGLRAAMPLDGVYLTEHGAGITTESDDPDGEVFALARRIVGPDVPVVATLDLHANISERMVDSLSVFVGYRENPHTDIGERGVEAAQHMRALLGGAKAATAMVRLPIVAPTIALLTARGPYADLIDYGQTKVGGPILNVSVMGGFAFSDTAKNGLTAVVTATDKGSAQALARDIAERAWAMRERFKVRMTPLDEAVRRAVEVGRDATLRPLIFADCADNPGGGGRGNTTALLRALKAAGAEGVLLGVFNDGALAAEAHRLGLGARFRARFNTKETDRFSEPFEADATVLRLGDGKIVGRRGIVKGVALEMGPCAALDLGGVIVVVITNRQQCADPMMLECLGFDIGKMRSVVVKSRGHFRSGFDEFFAPEQVIEVDGPGLTSPDLKRFPWKRLPRPVYPMDENATWSPPA